MKRHHRLPAGVFRSPVRHLVTNDVISVAIISNDQVCIFVPKHSSCSSRDAGITQPLNRCLHDQHPNGCIRLTRVQLYMISTSSSSRQDTFTERCACGWHQPDAATALQMLRADSENASTYYYYICMITHTFGFITNYTCSYK